MRASSGSNASTTTLCVEDSSYPPTPNSCTINCAHTEQQGHTSFVGAASSGARATAAMDYRAPFVQQASRVTARKTYHFYGTFAVMMTTDVTAGVGWGARGGGCVQGAATGVAQQRLSGKVLTSSTSTSGAPVAEGSHRLRAWWVHHDRTGYVVTCEQIRICSARVLAPIGLAASSAPPGPPHVPTQTPPSRRACTTGLQKPRRMMHARGRPLSLCAAVFLCAPFCVCLCGTFCTTVS